MWHVKTNTSADSWGAVYWCCPQLAWWIDANIHAPYVLINIYDAASSACTCIFVLVHINYSLFLSWLELVRPSICFFRSPCCIKISCPVLFLQLTMHSSLPASSTGSAWLSSPCSSPRWVFPVQHENSFTYSWCSGLMIIAILCIMWGHWRAPARFSRHLQQSYEMPSCPLSQHDWAQIFWLAQVVVYLQQWLKSQTFVQKYFCVT